MDETAEKAPSSPDDTAGEAPSSPDETAGEAPSSLDETAEEASQQGAFNEETGEINWDCPCLGGMAHGPCGEDFRASFSCFVFSKEDPKGMDCIEHFRYTPPFRTACNAVERWKTISSTNVHVNG